MAVFRICMRAGGKTTEGPLSDVFLKKAPPLTIEFVKTYAKLHRNATFFISGEDYAVCDHRLKNNLSDLSTELRPPPDGDTFYSVPVPAVPIKIGMMTGFDLDDIKSNAVDALGNFRLLDLSIYLLTGAFILLFALIVMCATYLFVNRKLKFEAVNRTRGARRMKRRDIIHQQMKRQLRMFFSGSSHRFRFMTFLFTLLTFYLVTYYCAVYSTSNIVLKQPDLVDSYRKLVDHPTSMPFFTDFLFKVTDEFRNAPVDSLKGQVWSKIPGGLKQTQDYNLMAMLQSARDGYELMKKNQDVLIGSSLILPVSKAMYCATNRETESPRRILIGTDESEGEKLIGFALSHRFEDRTVVRRLRLLAQSTCLDFLQAKWASATFDDLGALLNNSRSHILKQKMICGGEMPLAQCDVVDSVPLFYYLTFILSLLGLIAFSLVILAIEIMCNK